MMEAMYREGPKYNDFYRDRYDWDFTDDQLDQNSTILEARRHVQSEMAEGVFCPVCDRWAKLNRVSLRLPFVNTLTWLRKASSNGKQFVHIMNHSNVWVLRGKGHTNLLQKWGFIVGKRLKDVAPGSSDNKIRGYWTITDLGKEFLDGTEVAPLFMIIYNNKIVDVSKSYVRFNGQDFIMYEHRDEDGTLL